MTTGKVAALIIELVRTAWMPVPRNVVEAILRHYGVQPHQVTVALRMLRSHPARVKLHQLRIGETASLVVDAYSVGDVSNDALATLESLLRQKDDLFKPEQLRFTSENYVRRQLMRSRLFHCPQRHRLGQIRVGGLKPADLLIRYRGGTPNPGDILIEVKNQREWFYPRPSTVFRDLISKALDYSAFPVIAAAHLSPRALQLCRRHGIGVLHLKRQIIPRIWKPKIRQLWPAIGPEEFEYVNPADPFHHGLTENMQRDLAIVSDPEWLTGSFKRWQANTELNQRYVERTSRKPKSIEPDISPWIPLLQTNRGGHAS